MLCAIVALPYAEPVKKRAIAFDLDGTLLDTLQDLAEAVNEVLLEEGLSPHPQAAYRYFVGDGLAKLVERVLPEDLRDGPTLERLIARTAAVYGPRSSRNTRPYPGIGSLLDALDERGVTLAILSNKPHPLTTRCVAAQLGRWPFAAVYGARPGIPTKPDPQALLGIFAELSIPAEQWLYVGDTAVDMQTGTRAKVTTLGVSWGFRPRQELIEAGAAQVIDAPEQLLALLD